MSDIQQRQEASLDPEVASSHHSPGEMLKREREHQGLALDEVVVQLNLRSAVVIGLEADQYSEVPVAAYRRGYLRAYARLLGMDEAAVVNAYNAQHGDTKSDIERKITPVHTTRPPSRIGAWIFKLFTLLVILGLVGLTLLWWQSRDGNDLLGLSSIGDNGGVESMTGQANSTSGDTPAAGSDESASGDTGEPLPPLPETDSDMGLVENDADNANTASGTTTADGADDASGEAAANAGASDGSTDANGANTQASESTSGNDIAAGGASTDDGQAMAQTPAVNERQLSLTFNEQSWTEIFDANDQRILVGLQSAGTQASAEGDPPFRLTIGNASGVELDYKGESVDLGAHTGGNNVARFTLGE